MMPGMDTDQPNISTEVYSSVFDDWDTVHRMVKDRLALEGFILTRVDVFTRHAAAIYYVSKKRKKPEHSTFDMYSRDDFGFVGVRLWMTHNLPFPVTARLFEDDKEPT